MNPSRLDDDDDDEDDRKVSFDVGVSSNRLQYERPQTRTICGVSRALFFLGVCTFVAILIAASVLGTALKPSHHGLSPSGYTYDNSPSEIQGGNGEVIDPTGGQNVPEDPAEGEDEDQDVDNVVVTTTTSTTTSAPITTPTPNPGQGEGKDEGEDTDNAEDADEDEPPQGPAQPTPIPNPPPEGAEEPIVTDPIPHVSYHVLTYDQIVQRLLDLQDQYPNFVEVFTTQERFGLPAAGTCFLQGRIRDCANYVITITNKAKKTASTPEVFVSGALHGDERTGPTATTEFATLLLQMYVRGDKWARTLVDSRNIVMMPAPNALGYSQNKREEKNRDPNRDFAWDQSASACMTTIAAQSINELWLRHIFQLSITFHGGTHLIAYPWGDFIHCCSRNAYTAPDMTGMEILTENLRAYVGEFTGQGKYPIGALNDIIYKVRGGMEDWAYGASWDSRGNVQCTGGEGPWGYPRSRTVYNNATHRSVNLLVEASNSKTPPAHQLGTNTDVIARGGGRQPGGGHIPRNIRLIWMMVDAVQPWVHITNEDDLPTLLSEEVEVEVRWDVGGAFEIDMGTVECLGEGETSDSHQICDADAITREKIWANRDPVGEAERSFVTTFKLLPLATARSGGRVRVRVAVMVDQAWGTDTRPEHNKGPPQTHFVRARTDPQWHAENRYDGHHQVVHGQLRWYSREIEITPQPNTLLPRR